VWHALQVEVHRLVWFVGILSFTVAIILFVIGLARKMSPLPAFVNGFILVVVANVPEVCEGCFERYITPHRSSDLVCPTGAVVSSALVCSLHHVSAFVGWA
jgi:hypothetical protein